MSAFTPRRRRAGRAVSLTVRPTLCGELLEPRWTPAWSGIPPATIRPPASAAPITLNSQNDANGTAAITSSEVDYYAFTAAVSGSYRLAATTPSSSLDSVLGLFSSSGQRLAYNDDISSSNLDSQATVNLTAGTRYLIGITNYTGSANGSYAWRIDGPSSTPTPTPTDDAYENNDTLGAASNLGTLAAPRTLSGLAMADASDYFKFTIQAAGTSDSHISVSSTSSLGDLDLELYNSAGTRVARSQGTTSSERISLNGLAAGTYTARVYPYGGVTNISYSLTVNPPTINSTPTVDLSGVSLSVTNATSWGQTISVSAAVRNSGNTAAGNFVDQWYLSRDAVGSADDILLSRTGGAGTSYTLSGIAANSISATFTTTLQLPAVLPAGWAGTSFFLVMRTDASNQVSEVNENNNFGQAGLGLDFAPITIGGTTQTGGFQIQLNMTGLTVTQQSTFQRAARRWEEVIVGDLPNATYNGQTVDDLLIDARATAIDGVGGTLGQAGPDRFRSNSRLAYHGVMSFDTADMAAMERDGSLFSVVAHEIGHILGIGTLWDDFGLLTGTGTSNPLYTGASALAAYNQISGRNASGVPVENTGGGGTRDSHWRESVLGNEIMTGYAGPGVNLPISRITVGALADLGYVVSTSAADPYTPPSASRSAAAAASSSTTSAARLSETTVSPSDSGVGLSARSYSSRYFDHPSRSLLYEPGVDAIMAGLAQDSESAGCSHTNFGDLRGFSPRPVAS